MKNFILNWYPVILAFICLLYSVGLGILGVILGETEGQEFIDKAQYSAHWPGTILLFALVIRQRRTT
jgi:hypothetical protein|tara:strand:+ start:244 stop:444 length:201 start_codon:yes stop_codon:yes gene_type:complete